MYLLEDSLALKQAMYCLNVFVTYNQTINQSVCQYLRPGIWIVSPKEIFKVQTSTVCPSIISEEVGLKDFGLHSWQGSQLKCFYNVLWF